MMTLMVVATPALAAGTPNAGPVQQIAELGKQDQRLRERMGQLQLDLLVARVDRLAHPALDIRARSAATAADREIAMFGF